MNAMLWNVRGTGARSFPTLIKDLTNFHKLDFIALFETRCGGDKAVRIASRLGFNNMHLVDAEGYKGGIWCLWSDKLRKVEIIETSNQYVHIRITNRDLKSWLMTLVYASPQGARRRELWRKLARLGENIQEPWCLGGDFNATLLASERKSFGESTGPDKNFCDFMDDMNFSDVGFIGPIFTWKRTGIESRLDRVISNSYWLNEFSNASVTHLNWLKSDHRPLLLNLNGYEVTNKANRPFRFNAAWVLDDRFKSLVQGCWDVHEGWINNVKQFSAACFRWNKEVFGFTTDRKRRILKRIDGITRVEARTGLTFDLEILQKDLWKELAEVMIQESLIWAQKARSEWYVHGDRNTKFFHAIANGRRKKNYIGAIRDENDEWVFDVEIIKNMGVSFFTSLFNDELPTRPDLICDVTFPQIRLTDLISLDREISEAEIKNSLFSMGALKAPGPDGLNALFYQSQWEHVGKSIIDFIHYLWDDPVRIKEINETLIVLIPKKECPEVFQDLRPISLCNVIFKVVTKLVANRIKAILPYVVSPNQCSFVPGRHSSDNIIVAQEVIHSMRSMTGKKGFFAIKIDLEKAYDRVNWRFLINCLQELNLPSKLVDIIEKCVTTPSMKLLWNGEEAGVINPSRGVRQGDPMSPFLFVLCMEKFAHMIQERINANNWAPIKLGKNGPPISHLFFADDVILFAEASIHQAMEVKNCIDKFCEASGLKVNERKTRVFFSKNINHNRRTELCDILGFQVTPDLGKYLGVNLHHERVVTATFQDVVDKVRKRLSTWKCNSLSMAGRSTLISSVTSSIPEYTMQTAFLPISTCDSIDKCNRAFLWGSSSEKKKTHLVAWDKVCRSKKNGGLGIKHLHAQNQAYMAKLG